MTRNAVILIFLSALAGVAYFACHLHDVPCTQRETDLGKHLESDYRSNGSVFALRDIGVGEVIRRRDFREQNERIGGAGRIGSISAIEGFRTSKRIDEGQELTTCQIDFSIRYSKSVVGVNHLLAGSVVKAGDVVEGYVPESANAIMDISLVLGKRVKREFGKSDIITRDMIE